MYIHQNAELCKLTNRLHLELLTLGHAIVDPSWSGSVVSPVYSRVYYILDGSFTIQGETGSDFKLEGGNWYLIPSGYSFHYSCKNSMEHFYFHIKLCDFDGTDLLKNCKTPLRLNTARDIDCSLLYRSIKSNNITDGLSVRQTVLGVLLALLQEYDVTINAEDFSPCIYKALLYIKQHLSMELSISEIAKNIFVSQSTLTKHFQKELNVSVNAYIYNTIMAEAERLLISSNISIRDLAHKFGYADQLYFSRRFKEKFGKSPREYRKEKHI